MELLKKLELSMEDVRMLQAEAKKGRAAQNTSGADSKNTSGDAARQNVSAKGKANRKDRRQNGFNIRNTDTAMGRALAAAMQGMTLDADNGGTGKKEQTHRGGLAQVHRTLQMRRQEPLQAAAHPAARRQQPFLHWNAAFRTRKGWRKSLVLARSR